MKWGFNPPSGFYSPSRRASLLTPCTPSRRGELLKPSLEIKSSSAQINGEWFAPDEINIVSPANSLHVNIELSPRLVGSSATLAACGGVVDFGTTFNKYQARIREDLGPTIPYG